jgi:hypothetical protein
LFRSGDREGDQQISVDFVRILCWVDLKVNGGFAELVPTARLLAFGRPSRLATSENRIAGGS